MIRAHRTARARTTRLTLAVLLASLVSACSDAAQEKSLALDPLCAESCTTHGILEGNAAISGVRSADTYFGAVVAFQGRANAAAAGLEASLGRLEAAFGAGNASSLAEAISRPGLELLFAAPKATVGEARCFVDVARTVARIAQCEGADPEKQTLSCSGVCMVALPGTCDFGAELYCESNAAASKCSDSDSECFGSCESPWRGRACPGICTGTCSGSCDRYASGASDGSECAGYCDGTCDGQCARPIADARCDGKCTGTCTAKAAKSADSTCATTDISASCVAGFTVAGNGVECSTACNGNFAKPANIKAECRAAAFAQGKLDPYCDTPVAVLRYALSKEAKSAAEVRYESALHELQHELPPLLIALAKADLIQQAGQELAALAKTEVDRSFERELEAEKPLVQELVGLRCARAELAHASPAVNAAKTRLTAAIGDAETVLSAVGAR